MVQIAPGNQISPFLKWQGYNWHQSKSFCGFCETSWRGQFSWERWLPRGCELMFFCRELLSAAGRCSPCSSRRHGSRSAESRWRSPLPRVPRRALGAELLTPAPTDFTTALRTKINIVAGESWNCRNWWDNQYQQWQSSCAVACNSSNSKGWMSLRAVGYTGE